MNKTTPNQAKTNSRKVFTFLLPFVFLLLTLTGCVRYEVGVNFDEQHHGTIIQHIQLSQKLTGLSQAETNKWLTSIKHRASALQGKAKQISSQEILVIIPFNNGQELTEKFNQFFNPTPSNSTQPIKEENLELVNLNAEMSLNQSNWLFLEQNRLHLSVDLRALGVLSNQGNIIISPGSLIDLEFVLNTPLFANNIVSEDTVSEVTKNGQQLIWKLKPGQINTIDAVFWIPSYLGIGTAAIIVLMILGFFLKYRRFPGVGEPVKA